MKRSCSVWFAFYVIAALGVAAVVYHRFPVVQAAAIAGVIGGGVLWLGLGYFWGIRTKFADSAMIRRAFSGDPPREGDKIAAIGPIEPTGPALTSPLTQTRCVAYKYEIKTGSGDDEITHFDGFALTPSAIQSRQGSIRLLGWPDLKWPPEHVPAATAQRNAEQYVAATEFRELKLADFRKSIAEMMAIYRDDDGSVRWDQRPGSTAFDPTNAIYREWLLRPGQTVCAIGRYSVERGGIVPSPEPLVDPITLQVGDVESFSGRSVRGAGGYFIGGAIFIGIAAVAFLAFLAFIPLAASEQMSPSMVASWPEIRLEQWIERRLRVPMRRAGMLASGETVSIELPAGAARGRVRIDGGDRAVSTAIARRQAGGTEIAIDDVATLTLDAHDQPRRFVLGGREVPPDDAWIEVDDLSGRITYVSDARACRITFHAGER